ncbi:MAG: cyclic nucleotide-binding domain-containing protein [Polyangiaceae bacterium]|nr:cyclic nucleotide-binding domain-containing protein [Polyangiaceae bacterium]
MPAPAPAADSPLDHAMALSAAGQHEAALRHGGALLQSDPGSPPALLLSARALAALGRPEASMDALRVCVGRAIDAGNLPLAVAACCEAKALGDDPSAQLDAIAAAFASTSPRLLHHGATPPELGAHDEFEPLPSKLAGAALLAKVEELLRAAKRRFETDQIERDVDPKFAAHPLFSSLTEPQLRALVGIFEVSTVPAGAVVIEQGTSGAEAYMLARGQLEVRRALDEDGERTVQLAVLGSGTLFGEMALLSRSPRAASVIARRPSVILVARKDALDKVAESQPRVGELFAEHCRRRMVENLVRTSSILRAVRPDERPILVERFTTRTFEQGEPLIVQGRESEGLHLIASGEVEVVHDEGDDTTLIARLGVGEVVGEVALVLRRPSTANVVAACPTVTLHLPRDHFQELIRQHPAILAQLYELAVKRDEETTTIVAQEATEADDFVLI